MTTVHRFARRAALVLALCVAPLAASAQDFPTKPVHVIVPFPPGGGTDALARIMAPYLGRIWGQTVIVENKLVPAGTSGPTPSRVPPPTATRCS